MYIECTALTREKRGLDRADRTAITRQHELDRTDLL